jgi:S-adenosylmethionine:tRNA ribosyltransferase-isomerase
MSAATLDRPGLQFELPPELEAHEPPEARGLRRDGVRLMVSRGVEPPIHARFPELPSFLAPGDLVVVNTSGTRAAAMDASTADGSRFVVHLSNELPAGLWLIEVRQPLPSGSTVPSSATLDATTLILPGGSLVHVHARFPGSERLWLATLDLPAPLDEYLGRHGRAIRYGYVARDWPLSAYQTVYATERGSAEMPSAGRPFTPEVVTALVARGVGVTPLVLDTGVSSLEGHELPYPEHYRVPAETAARVNATHAAGHRVVAVGTTVVRALETATDESGDAHPGEGWTEVVITPERGVRAVDGLLTGWHEPQASHLLMLEAVAGRPALELAYGEALAAGYHWHEFGDSHLLLPAPTRAN